MVIVRRIIAALIIIFIQQIQKEEAFLIILYRSIIRRVRRSLKIVKLGDIVGDKFDKDDGY